jgi:hypothetical protein
MAVMKNAHKILVGMPEGKKPLGRLRHSWENNIKMYVKERGCQDVKQISVAQDKDQWKGSVIVLIMVDLVIRNHQLNSRFQIQIP